MTDLQAWVNSKYPTKKDKEQVRDLFLNKPDLIGELDLSEFRNQYRNCYTVSISQLVNESKIILKNKPEKVEIIKMF